MMDYFSSKGKSIDHSELTSSLLEGVASGSTYEDRIDNTTKQINLDAFGEWGYSLNSVPDQIFPSFVFPPTKVSSTVFSPFNELNFIRQYNPETSISDDKIIGSTFVSGDEVMIEDPIGSQLSFATTLASDGDGFDLTETGDESLGQQNAESICSLIPRAPVMQSLAERMLTALDRFKQWSREGILAQVWVPVRNGNCYVLSTCEQPYLLDQMLSGYREVSRSFTFASEPRTGSFLGLPGRVFSSKIPEWTTNIMYYNKHEFLRVQHALDHEVRGSIALPVFEYDGSPGSSCCAVLELATMKDKSDFDLEMENVRHALAAVNLRSTISPRLYPQSLSSNQRAALAEIYDVLRTVCFAHLLPLALTWISCSYREDCGVETIKVHSRGYLNSSNEKCVLCIEDTACYVNDKDMKGFVHACGGCYLEEGQGIAGKALQSNRPFFHPDVKQYDICEYPLVHHARKFGLNAAVAIRLRSTYTNDNDYVIEFFLPVNVRGNTEQLLLNNLSSTMHRVCKSLRTVSDDEFHGKVNLQDVEMRRLPPILLSGWSPERSLFGRNLDDVLPINKNLSEPSPSRVKVNVPSQQPTSGSSNLTSRKRSATEKHVSLSVLQQYFSGSLKDAAKSIGVCPTTLKRICRLHGIMRWPSRKIKKVKRSLKKIQGVIDFVQGMEGGLKLNHPIIDGDLAVGSIGSMIQELNLGNGVFRPDRNDTHPLENLEPAIQNVKFQPAPSCTDPEAAMTNTEKQCSHQVAGATSSSMTDSCNGSGFGSTMNNSSSSSQSLDKKQNHKIETSYAESGAKLIVKATYKENTVRFKLEGGGGCVELYEQVAKRFKLEMGQFQLKYLDDEEEWVLLVTDSDLQECLEILDYVGTRYVKFLVHDVPAVIGSSGDSNCFLEAG